MSLLWAIVGLFARCIMKFSTRSVHDDYCRTRRNKLPKEKLERRRVRNKGHYANITTKNKEHWPVVVRKLAYKHIMLLLILSISIKSTQEYGTDCNNSLELCMCTTNSI